jgi:spore coat protein CotH
MARSLRHLNPVLLRMMLAGAVCQMLTVSVAAQTDADFFDPAVLHRLDLLVNSRDWETLQQNFQENYYYPADLRWRGVTIRNVGIRSRGSGSRNGTKPGLLVDINRYASGQTFLGLASFVLDNLVQDPSGLRERVAMRVHERMGLPAPRETYAVLYVNNSYAGVYGIVESVDKVSLKRMFGEQHDNSGNDGYLFEFKWIRPYYFEYLGGDVSAYAPLFSPRTHEHEPLETLYSPIEAMTRAVEDAPDASFVEIMAQYLDLAMLLRYVAVQAYTAEWDGLAGYAGMNNFYLYRFEQSMRSQFIPWDADTAFHDVAYPVLQGFDENVLLKRLMRIPAMRELFFDALAATAASVMNPVDTRGTPWIEQEIETGYALIAPWMEVDLRKPYTNDEFKADVTRLVDFARERAAFVQQSVGGHTVGTSIASTRRLRRR